jgi:hypothetical protein
MFIIVKKEETHYKSMGFFFCSLAHWDLRTNRNIAAGENDYEMSLAHWDLRTNRN